MENRTCKDIINLLEELFPSTDACSWDNIGLLVGRCQKEVRRIYLALDATKEIIEDAVNNKADLLITHHPMLFSAVKQVRDDDFIGERIITLIQADISYVAVHTNYDVGAMAGLSGEIMNLEALQVLEETGELEDGSAKGIGRVGDLPQPMTLAECAQYVKERFCLEHVKVFGDVQQEVRRAAVSPGSGKHLADAAVGKGAEVLISGDIDHHEGIDAVAKGICIIDAGHYGLEQIFIEDMKERLGSRLEGIEIITEHRKLPYQIL